MSERKREKRKNVFDGNGKKRDFAFFLLLCNKSGQPSQNCFLTRKPPGVKVRVSVCVSERIYECVCVCE